jgi:deoxyribonuclease V
MSNKCLSLDTKIKSELVMSSSKVLTDTVELQNEVAKKVILENTQKNIDSICGVDVAYRNNIAYCSAVLTNKYGKELDKPISTTINVTHPYIPSFFMLREYEPIINTLKLLQNRFHLLLIDGHGVLHPRRLGMIASHISGKIRHTI